MAEKSPEMQAADELSRALLNRLAGLRVDRVAAIAQVQSTLTNAAVQSIITLLIQKNIISQHELADALRHHYEQQLQKVNDGPQTIIVPEQAPIARPL